MAVAQSHPTSADLEAFALGALDDASLAAVEAHVVDCPTCQERAATASGDSLVELLRRSHARTPCATDTVADGLAQAPTPAPAPGKDVTQALLSAADVAACEPVAGVPAELARHERYRVLRLLGQGGMGAVYEAEHRAMQRAVALKVINRAYTGNDAAVERFRREVRAAARLAHPNIVAAYDAETAGDTHFLVMEYIEGTSLARLVKEGGPLPVAEACDCVRQAALGLQHAHERGMVHRDVKPDNLIRCADGTVKVLDFGLAALTAERGEGLTDVNAVMGTPDYMAPEQAEDARSADIRADMYSLGCTLYYLLTGNAPYPAPTALTKILAHRTQPLPSLRQVRPEVPPELACVMARMLAKKPEDRYQTPREVAAALQPFLQTGNQGAKRRSRRGWVVAAALFLGLAVAAVAVYRIQTDNGELVITSESDDVEVVIKQGGKEVRVVDTKGGEQITLVLRSGVYQLQLKGAPRGLKLNIGEVTLRRGEQHLAKIVRVAKRIDDRPVTPQALSVGRRLPWPGRHNLATSFSADGRLCVAFPLPNNAFRVYETETGRLVQAVDGLPPTVTVRFLPDGKQLLSSHTDGIFRRWDLSTGKLLQQIRTTETWPQIQGFTADGEAFAWVAEDVQVWDLKTGKERFRVKPVGGGKTGLAFCAPLSPDGKRLLTVDYERRQVRIFETATGKLLLSKSIPVRADICAWSADGRSVYLNNGTHILRLDAESGDRISQVALVPEPGSSYGRAFSRDTRYFAVQYPAATFIHLYDTDTGRLVGTASGPNAPFSLSFSPSGQYLACGGQGEIILHRLPEPPARDRR